MSKRTLLIVNSCLLLAGLWAATEWVASRLLYDRALGGSLYVAGEHIYTPWAIFVWQHRFGAVAPEPFTEGFGILALTFVVMVLTTAALRHAAFTFQVRALGKHHWASLQEMKAAGLFAGTGTVVGEYHDTPLTYDGPEHQLVSGASRSGKGVGHVVPTLLTWPRSALVYDVKGELFTLTAGWRSRHSTVALFSPTRTDAMRFNPLFEVRKGAYEIRDAQNIAEMLVNPDGSKKTLDIWDTKAAELLVALILHVLYSAPDDQKNLATVREKLLDFERSCREMAETPHLLNRQTGEIQPHPEVARVARDLLAKYEKFRDSVCATAGSYLTLYADPTIATMTSTSDFLLSDLMCGHKPFTLYLQPPPSDAPRLRPLVRLILSQVCRALMEELNTDHLGRKKNHRLLLLLDEFPTLGKLEFFDLNMRQMAGYGIKAHLIVQSFNDILQAYGANNTLIDNCHILSAFASADTTTCQRISQMSGMVTEFRPSYSQHHTGWGFARWGRRSVSYSEQVRPLLQPGNVRELPYDQQLLFVTGHKPMRVSKLRYFENRYFLPRLRPAPELGALKAVNKAPPVGWLGERAKGPRTPLFEEQIRSNVPPKRRAMPLFEGDTRALSLRNREPRHDPPHIPEAPPMVEPPENDPSEYNA